MSNEHENSADYTIYETGKLGQVKISNEVIAVIAGIAAMETDGVASMTGNSGRLQKDIISRLGMKVLSKGVRIAVEDCSVKVELSVILDYGCSIPEVTKAVQDRVKNAIESMTGLKVHSVNVQVMDVKLEEE